MKKLARQGNEELARQRIDAMRERLQQDALPSPLPDIAEAGTQPTSEKADAGKAVVSASEEAAAAPNGFEWGLTF